MDALDRASSVGVAGKLAARDVDADWPLRAQLRRRLGSRRTSNGRGRRGLQLGRWHAPWRRRTEEDEAGKVLTSK